MLVSKKEVKSTQNSAKTLNKPNSSLNPKSGCANAQPQRNFNYVTIIWGGRCMKREIFEYFVWGD